MPAEIGNNGSAQKRGCINSLQVLMMIPESSLSLAGRDVVAKSFCDILDEVLSSAAGSYSPTPALVAHLDVLAHAGRKFDL